MNEKQAIIPKMEVKGIWKSYGPIYACSNISLSVGVGEILAVILLLRGFSVMFSVAAGVMVSACTVLAGVPFFIYHQLISFDVLIYAAPGALIGGLVARHIAQALGAKKLKLFLGGWILLVGLIGVFEF